MSIPKQLQQAIEEALAAMRSHPHHELNWRYRRAIYQAFGDYEENLVRAGRDWLAILTAQKVLPIFTSQVPHEPMPLQLIVTAIKVHWTSIDPESAFAIEEEGYHSFGDMLARDAFELRPYTGPFNKEYLNYRLYHNAECAAQAAYKTLLEVLGSEDPFKWIHNVSYHKEFGIKKLGPPENNDWVGGKNFTDNQLALDGHGNVASAAAVAYACSADSFDCDSLRLKEFWEWWLNEAIPLAWKYAIKFSERR